MVRPKIWSVACGELEGHIENPLGRNFVPLFSKLPRQEMRNENSHRRQMQGHFRALKSLKKQKSEILNDYIRAASFAKPEPCIAGTCQSNHPWIYVQTSHHNHASMQHPVLIDWLIDCLIDCKLVVWVSHLSYTWIEIRGIVLQGPSQWKWIERDFEVKMMRRGPHC